MERIKRFKEKAEFFLENKLKAFIKDSANNFYFCNILTLGETHLIVHNFDGQRKGEDSEILWIDIESFNEYKEREDLE